MKFGGSSVATAERMREVLDIIRTFPEQHPCVVLSAMGKVILTHLSRWTAFAAADWSVHSQHASLIKAA